MREAAPLTGLTTIDGIAVVFFLLGWSVFSWLTEASPWSKHSLTHAMNRQREIWIARMAERELRMIDTQIMAGLQNGTAFFASTSLLAIGAGFALLNASDRIIEVFGDMPFVPPLSESVYEVKVIGLILIYAYAFFKFGWAYRLFNYASILIGAVPLRERADPDELAAATRRASAMTVIAGRHFNRGLRAFFMSVGYLGWFLGPQALVATAGFVLLVLARRQFASDSKAALGT